MKIRHIKKERRKISRTRCIGYVFLGSFFLGIILANISGIRRLKEFGIFNTYYLEQLQYVKIQTTDLFSYIFRCRVSVLVLLAVAGMTRFWKQSYVLFTVWSGGAFGYLCVSAIVNLGVRAVLLVTASLLPQYLFYVPMFFLMLWGTDSTWKKRMMGTAEGASFRVARIAVITFLVLTLFLLGICSETFLNPVFMRKLLALF